MIFSNFYKIISTAKVLNIIYFRFPLPPKQLLTAYFLTNVKKQTISTSSVVLKRRNMQPLRK